jgi:NitT/TauT family transport system ATP-binding protein
MTSTPELEINNLNKSFSTKGGELLALENISMKVYKNEFACIVGASGCGKSTLLNIIAGLDQQTSGEILLEGRPVSGPGADRGMVFQNYTLYPWLTVAENIEFGLKLKGISSSERKERVNHYMDIVGLSKFAQSLPKTLSGGMKQRTAIARALANEPDILLMDEPFGALDAQTKEVLQEFMLQVWEQTKKTILMITHDVEEAVFLAQRIYVLSSRPGRIKAEVDIPLGMERDFSIKRTELFQLVKQEVLDLLREETLKVISQEVS